MSIIDIGLDRYGIINDNIPINKIITVKIISISHQGKYFQLQRIKPVDYWGYDVVFNNSLKDVLTSNDYDIKIITSKFGDNFHLSSKLILDKLDKKSHSSIIIAFGSPKTGLMSVLSREKIDKSNLILINLFPDQGVETIRSEEAILAGLSLFNSLFTR